MTTWTEIQSSHSGWIWARLAFSSIADAGVFVGAIGALGCGVLAWTYQTGSARLGVVDLFACEIATLCRVAAVTDMVERYINLFRIGPLMTMPSRIDGDMPTNGGRFNSQESYFPLFEASVKDLQQLEAVEYEPTQAEDTFTILLRELVAYAFLREQFKGDLKYGAFHLGLRRREVLRGWADRAQVRRTARASC